MKKLNKKQKLVCFIATLIIVVILAIVVTTNIISNKNQITSEGYLATTANANSNLVASYIKEGITIGGITGTLKTLDTYDATATAEDIALGKIAYARGERIVGVRGPISKEKKYVGYYADINGDETPDGIIYADLAIGGSGVWGESYEIPTETNFKEYQVSKTNFDGPFGKRDVIKATSSGNERFYVMDLEDIDSKTHFWYAGNYSAAQGGVTLRTSEEFGMGKQNTANAIEKWNKGGSYGEQNANDMWGLIKDKVSSNWFVPSKMELIAFAGELKINSSNYLNYNLKDSYWSSTRTETLNAECVEFKFDRLSKRAVDSLQYVRLSTTF